ncbi:hypothetical protein KL930_005124 [Ogataea haglerorum]|uniref:glucan endo-1,3-beta-D-glucosidase n=1 Tax=Ogataea haglerorum TaxID=1937702 RepID=A0AAN6HYJ9_9ASCO|nr:uncharacterized protein KL911_005135 [Ogataea haglerorum]KAG7692186.1 hypothetical protein KL951_005095 [Ogataea haglerorum]KAG7693751.1 hypothetical protein KL915_004041 [Ogataea haglerorum]KAG7702695.1 hypothetical protein KL914_005082 [Ogataea haglerorum]KAG7713411.1 hypothetical protein KL913_005032 [Ogataea haglerorum]KAG7713907.1 hypothetical protein KL949_005070 [Ogataea haglerorum]
MNFLRLALLATALAGNANGNSAHATASAASASVSSSQVYSDQYGVLQFQNFGFEGYFFNVKSIDSSSNDSCTCEVNRHKPVNFEGPISPLNNEVSVHIRGPINLQKFGYYVADDYTFGQTNGSWSRLAYYDSDSRQADNVTFLGNVGENVTCLGRALDYVDADGVSPASESAVLDNVTLHSNQELVLMSNVTCGDSGFGKDCGVYRDGIPAYHGYYGTTKMFLFQFLAPEEDTVSEDTASYNMPAIWLLNAHIPRTAQYPTNANCSCWSSGCGEFDIFEILNTTEALHFYSTIHDYQGTGDIETGLANEGYLERTPDAVMTGGVVFGSDGTATVFLSNSTSFDETISNADLSDWISSVEKADSEHTMMLSSATNTINGAGTLESNWWTLGLLAFMCVL